MGILTPSEVRLSPHFLLSDFMGCDSVYALGLPNTFNKLDGFDKRLANGQALCENALEPILALVGPISVSYGFIAPSLSREIVTYQDWRKPSHHRWDLGAAADICPHNWVQGRHCSMLCDSSPIEFALMHLQDMPISRLITYSESPFLCVAVSAEEVEAQEPRMAWYENRYTGRAKAKPQYLKYPTAQARQRALDGLEAGERVHDWQGAGFPTYHGGGRRQLHHVRISKYTVLSDWLYDDEWVHDGVKNVPHMSDENVRDAFRRVGEIYDHIIDKTGLPRMSIVSGYTNPRSAGWLEHHDWRGRKICFELIPPAYKSPKDVILSLIFHGWPKNVYIKEHPDFPERLLITIER